LESDGGSSGNRQRLSRRAFEYLGLQRPSRIAHDSESLHLMSAFEDGDLLAECEEFVLVRFHDGRVLARPVEAVFIAHCKAIFATNDAGEEGEEDAARILRAVALTEILSGYQRLKRGEKPPVKLAELIVEAFGPLLEGAIRSEDEIGLDDCQRKLSQAALHMRRLVVVKSPPPNSRTKAAYRIWKAIEVGRIFFEKHRRRPTKAYIRGELENLGVGYKGANHKKEWERLWINTGLQNLPSGH
jgi:hypothetical protein